MFVVDFEYMFLILIKIVQIDCFFIATQEWKVDYEYWKIKVITFVIVFGLYPTISGNFKGPIYCNQTG